MAGRRLWTQREIAASMEVNNLGLGQFLSQNRHRFPPEVVRGGMYYYTRDQAMTITEEYLAARYCTPRPAGSKTARINYYRGALKAARQNSAKAVRQLSKINSDDKIGML